MPGALSGVGFRFKQTSKDQTVQKVQCVNTTDGNADEGFLMFQ